jgi:hypothetical protein
VEFDDDNTLLGVGRVVPLRQSVVKDSDHEKDYGGHLVDAEVQQPIRKWVESYEADDGKCNGEGEGCHGQGQTIFSCGE